MEFNYRGAHQQASPGIPQPSYYGYFTEQARRAVSMGPDIGQTYCLHPHPRPFRHPSPPPHPHDMHEAIQREIEKERIREEIIMSEIARRRVLEAEVRRELMMERELALRRGGDGFPFGLSPQMEFDSPMGLSLLGTRAEGSSLEERIAMLLEETKRPDGRRESGGFDTLPFQRDLRISEVKPVSEGEKGKQKVIFLAKPDENISEPKRMAVTPPGVDASELLSNGILKKKAKEEWSCAICQVSATGERALNEHLQGKKHKSKEAALRAERAGKNDSIGLSPKRATKSILVVGTVDAGAEQEGKLAAEPLLFKKTVKGSSKRQDPPPLQENPNPDNLKKNQSGSVQKVQKNGDLKNEQYGFWCEMCKVGAFSQEVMNAHEKGKKHVSRLRESGQNGGAGPSHSDKIAVLVNHAEWVAEDGKNITKDNVDETMNEARSEADEFVDAVKPEDHELDDVVKPEDHKPLEETKEEDGGAVDASELLSNGILKKKANEEWSCAICQVSATGERALNEHVQGKKHKSKEAALRAERAGKNDSIGLSPKRATKSILVVGTVDAGAEQEGKLAAEPLLFKKTVKGSSKRQDPPPLQENPNPDNLKKNQSESFQKVEKNGDLKNVKYGFWCEMCKVGAFSQEVMNAHKKGKKHVSWLRESGQNGGAGLAVLVNHAEWVAEDGKNITKDNVDKTMNEVRSEADEFVDAVKPEDHELDDVVKPEDHKPLEETKEQDGGAAEPENGMTNDVVEPKDNGSIINYLKRLATRPWI